MAKSANRAHRVGGFKGADVDENTLVDSADADLVAMRKQMKEVHALPCAPTRRALRAHARGRAAPTV